jgi:hypothetical protein
MEDNEKVVSLLEKKATKGKIGVLEKGVKEISKRLEKLENGEDPDESSRTKFMGSLVESGSAFSGFFVAGWLMSYIYDFYLLTKNGMTDE